MKVVLPLLLGVLAVTGNGVAQSAGQLELDAHRDIVFAEVGESKLRLNLIVPKNVENPPLVVFIHGGGWKNGSYKACKVTWLVEHGFAVASIGYRLSQVATFPAQVHDCKGAVRWLRAHADHYRYNAEKIGVCGSSAGGQLAALVGTSAGVVALEGDTAGHLDQSSRVQAVINYYGPNDFVLRSRMHPAKTESPEGSVYKLLGGSASSRIELAKLASPAWQVSKDDAPMLVFHGTNDKTVQFNQAERIVEVYEKAGLPIELIALEGAGHGGKEFFSGKSREQAVAFFRKHLAAEKAP